MSTETIADRIARLSISKRALLETRLNDLGLDEAIYRLSISDTHNALSRDDTESNVTADLNDDFPLVVHATFPSVELTNWIEKNKTWVQGNLQQSGAILFRGFRIDGPEAFERCIERTCGKPTDYPGLTQSVSLRQHVHGKIYTSTEYSPAFRMRLHNECAFANTWPAQICFFCIAAPASGGETPIADSRRVLRRISQTTLNRLNQHGVRYVRNFGYGSSRTWEKTFGTSDKETVEEICRADGVTCEWLDQSRLRTWSVRPPIVMHPVTDEAVWFNHIHASHISSLEPELRDALLKEFKKEQLPRNCYYGDGSDIEQSVLQEIQEAYDAEAVAFTWQKGDLLMLDNMLVAHGRNQFTGSRKIVVGMAGAVKRDEL